MNKTNDVQKVRESKERRVELKAEMGQYMFLLYFHLSKASLRSLFPEHGGICVCMCMFMSAQARAYNYMFMDKCSFNIHAYMRACP